jgi:predicted permease
MGIRIVAGRGFTEQDRKGSPGVVIINEAMARRLFPGENALGKRVSQQTGGPSLEIVGITADVKHHDLTEEPLPHFDLPALQRGYDAYTNVVLRVRDNPANLISAARAELVGLDPTLLVDEIRPLSVQIDYALAATRLASTLIAIFGLVAMLLASIGLYGVIAWMVNRRTRELGIRIALGAQGGHVIRLILLRGFLLTIAGLALGLLVAFASTRLLASQLYGVETTDTFTFATVSILLTAVSMLACYLPARRATKVDPVEALRCE